MAVEKTKCLLCGRECDRYNVDGGCRCQHCHFSFAICDTDNIGMYFSGYWQYVPAGTLAVFSWEELYTGG